MACRDIAFALLCFALGLTQSGLPCLDFCEIKNTGQCEIPETMGTVLLSYFERKKPCAICNVTEQAQENMLQCKFPSDLVMLQVAGHKTKNGTLETLPRRLTNLRMLVLGPGNIRTVASGVFSGDLKIIQTLSMNSNAIQTVGIWFGHIWMLENLYLSSNEINEIEKYALRPLECLEHLDLTHNRLRLVEKWHFEGLRKLKCLKLSHNNISYITGKSFNHMRMLQEISLDYNRLAQLECDWLRWLPLRIHVQVQHNLIQTISAESFDAMIKRHVRLFVGENPFRCTCDLDLDSSKGARVIKDYESLQCSYPPSLLGRKIADVARETTRTINCGDGTNMASTKADIQITSGASSSKAPPAVSKAGTTEVTNKIKKKKPQQDSTTPEATKVWYSLLFKSAVIITTAPCPRNSTINKKIIKTTNNSLQIGNAPQTDDIPYHTAINTTTPSRRQETVLTEKIIFLNTLDKVPGPQQDGIATLSYITGTCLALLLLGGAMAACHKGYRRRQERHRVPGNAVNTSGGTTLQNSQQSTMGNPATLQPTSEQVPDVSNTDLDVSPYATTVEMANPMYDTTSTEPKGVRSIQDPPPLPNRQTINNPASQPQGMDMPQTADIPALPPRTHRHINYNPSTQPQGMEAGNIPASPPPNTNRHSNYNASALPQSSDTTQMGRIQDLPPRSNRTIPYGASSQQSSEIPPVHEIPDPTPRSKRHINSTSGSSQAQGLQIPPGEEVPDLPPRSNKYVNSSVPCQQ
ncbi:uncharacterized protein LOC144924193 [Branchiostoma floridae x Branchiostoma belcheri]